MEEASFVSKARTAFHSAAAKAERVFTDFKSDRGDSDKQSPVDLLNRAEVVYQKKSNNKKCDSESKHSSWTHVGTKQDWQDRFRNIKLGRKIVEDTEKSEDSAMAVPFYDENLYLLNMKNDLEAKVSEVIPSVESFIAASGKSVPPIYVLKQLAIAVEAGKKYKSMKDLLASSGDSSPARERSSLSLAAMKSLLLRDKEERFSTEYTKDDRVNLLIQSLFDADGNFLERNFGSGIEDITFTSLHKDIHGSPPQSLIVKISEVMGSFKAMRKMALFWCKAVTEMRQLWSEGQYIPCIPKDDIPDLHSCLLYQQFQVINCCLSRKRRRDIVTESLDYVISKASSDAELAVSQVIDPVRPVLYARISTGELILRLGAAQPFNNLSMLETGEPVYSPITQEEPLLTEDVIKETEEFVLRTGSVGAGCSQLLSDMQAFKAANPGCILEDFVRWISPPDWTENERSSDARDDTPSGDLRGQLSSRMQKEGNLWRELWETAKPMPAVRQAPLYDEDLAVEGILNYLEDILPSELFEQLFVSLVGLGLVIAESLLSHHSNFSKFFYECKDYVVASFQGGLWSEKVNDICEVYETVEAMLVNPDEVLKMFKQPETETGEISGETKRRFKRLSLKFGSNDKSSKKSTTQDSKNGQPFSTFFDRKSSLFSKKPPKPEIPTPAEKSPCPDENDCKWTLV